MAVTSSHRHAMMAMMATEFIMERATFCASPSTGEIAPEALMRAIEASTEDLREGRIVEFDRFIDKMEAEADFARNRE